MRITDPKLNRLGQDKMHKNEPKYFIHHGVHASPIIYQQPLNYMSLKKTLGRWANTILSCVNIHQCEVV